MTKVKLFNEKDTEETIYLKLVEGHNTISLKTVNKNGSDTTAPYLLEISLDDKTVRLLGSNILFRKQGYTKDDN